MTALSTMRTLAGVLLALLLAAACGGRGAQRLAPSPPLSAAGPFPGLPELPTGANDPRQAQQVSLYDNIQSGQAAVQSSHDGVFVNSPGLDMGPAGLGRVGWAIWRWGEFQNGNLPHALHADIAFSGSANYWVLLANYTLGQWQVLGPNTTSAFSAEFNAGDNYLSPSHNAYVAVLVTDNVKLTVNSLDLLCDNDAQPPGPPTGLIVSNIGVHSALLKWSPPLDPDLNHLVLYSGPADGFDPDGGGVTTLDASVDKALKLELLTGLTQNTPYFLRMRAYDAAGNYSLPSETVAFTTLADQPPVPDFTYSPINVQVGTPVTFNPAPTKDPDNLAPSLTTSWDWDNDGLDDISYAGLGVTQHTFNSSGPVTVKLTVSDGLSTVSVSQSFTVGQSLETRDTGYSLSDEPAVVAAADVDYTTGRIAAIVTGAGTPQLYYYNGMAWLVLSLDEMNAYKLGDVALGPGGRVGVVYYDQAATDLSWYIYETTGGPWTHTLTRALSGDRLSSGATLAYSPSGLVSVAMTHAEAPPFGQNPKYALSVYHQKANMTFSANTCYTNTYPGTPFKLRRNDTQSVCLYPSNNQLVTMVATDSAGTPVVQQDVASLITVLTLGVDPADDSRNYWAALALDGSIYYGDNFGVANGNNQKYVPADRPLILLGAGLPADNAGVFNWTMLDNNDETHMMGYSTATGTLSDIKRGTGLCDNGFGGWFHDGATDGVYTVTTEARDGTVTGYLLDGAGGIARQDPIAAPLDGTVVGDNSLAFITNNGGFTVLNRQHSPNALLHTASSVGGPFTTQELGLDTWAFPDCAASGVVPGDLLVGSLYSGDHLEVFYYPPGATTGTHIDTYTSVGACQMRYNPVSNQTLLVYTQGGGAGLVARVWDGVSMSAPTTFYSSSATINEFVVRARPDGEWGVAWDNLSSEVWLAETAGGTWQPANLLSTDTLNFNFGSIGMEYNAAGDAGIAVERSSGVTGMYFGLKALGGATADWELLNATQGFNSSSINVHFRGGTQPLVVYNDNARGVQLATDTAGVWKVANLPFYLKGNPLVSVLDPAGTLAVAGKDKSTGQSAVCFLSP